MAWVIDASGNLVEVDTGGVGSTMGVDNTQYQTKVPTTPVKDPGLAETSWWDSTKKFFTPGEGQKTSVGNNMLDALGTGVTAGTGLASTILTNKANKANQALAERKLANEEKQAKYLRAREAAVDKNKQTFASNLGGGATYVGTV